jgi:hypothetical protein
MSRRRVAGIGMFGWGVLAAAAMLVGGLQAAHAQAGLWAIDTHACFTDGSHCIKGIVKNAGSPYATKDACEKALQQVAQQYHQAKLNVMYIHCVQLKR